MEPEGNSLFRSPGKPKDRESEMVFSPSLVLLLCLIPSVFSRRTIACENAPAFLCCSPGAVRNVSYANYGRRARRTVCKGYSDRRCDLDVTEHVMERY